MSLLREPLHVTTVPSGLSSAALKRLLAEHPARLSALSSEAGIVAAPRPTRLTEREADELYAAIRASFDREARRIAGLERSFA